MPIVLASRGKSASAAPQPEMRVRPWLTSLTVAAALSPMPVHAEELSGFGAFLATDEAKQLGVYFAQTLISWGVPGAVALALVIASSSGSRDPGADDDELPPVIAKVLGMTKEPKEYLKIERLNARFASFDYSLSKAVVSKESALRDAERRSLERRFGAEVAAMGLTSEQVKAINKAEQGFRKVQAKITKGLGAKTRELRARTLSKRDSKGDKRKKEAATEAAAETSEPDEEVGALGAIATMSFPSGGGNNKKLLGEVCLGTTS